MNLYIDIETYSSVDIRAAGAYKYIESIDFEILLIAYAFGTEPVKFIDLAQGETMHSRFLEGLRDPKIAKWAHNAVFERLSFKAVGYDIPSREWYCSAVKAAYCGLPLALGDISKAMDLEEKGKMATGNALIKFFCTPCKPTKRNDYAYFNRPEDNVDKWLDFIRYCVNDVIAMREIVTRLSEYRIPLFDRENYLLDQKINDTGIEIDLSFAQHAVDIDVKNSKILLDRMRKLTQLDNPNSLTQLKNWLCEVTGKEIESLTKDTIPELIKEIEEAVIDEKEHTLYAEDPQKVSDSYKIEFLKSKNYTIESDGLYHYYDDKSEQHQNFKTGASLNSLYNSFYNEYRNRARGSKEAVIEVLELKLKASKTSIKKYTRMLECTCDDNRAHGLFQFYGARTGRWAGRLIQLQNLTRNHIDDIQGARDAIARGDEEVVNILYGETSSILSQLVRTAFVAKKGYVFAVADFSAIEARVLAWLAQEKWRVDVFNSHGKIYEASAAMMFNVDISEVTKGSAYRDKGKISELALGYGGSVGAMKTMGGEDMGLSETEMKSIVDKWREKSPAIVDFWYSVDKLVKRALRSPGAIYECFKGKEQNLKFEYDTEFLTIQLPSGRKLFYYHPSFTVNKWGNESIKYRGSHPTKKLWTWLETYGGKLTENIVQAIARDLLAFSMINLDKAGFSICMHVHDEAISEVKETGAKDSLQSMCEIMSIRPTWAKELPLNADGYLTPFYKKD